MIEFHKDNDGHKVLPGFVFQINPDKKWGGAFIVATDVYAWGVQGYFYVPCYGSGECCMTFRGVAYVRVNYEDMRYVGIAPWKIEDDPKEIDQEK